MHEHRASRRLGHFVTFASLAALIALGCGSSSTDDTPPRKDASAPPLVCNGGLAACGDACTDLQSDRANCGVCAKACAGNCTAGACVPLTCAEVLAATPSSLSGVYTIDPDGTGAAAPFPAYCDMLEDGGGWTLLITLDPTAVTFATIAAWPTSFATSGGPPTTTGMYKGTLAPFKDVREEVASGKVKVWGKGKTAAQLELIRNLYAYQARVTAAPTFADVPSCRLAYATATDDLLGCTHYPGTDVNGDSVIGWTVDPSATYDSTCWFARGNCCSTAGGSSRCIENPNAPTGETNGTTWARTWFR